MNAYLAWVIILGIIWLVLYAHRKDLRYEMLFSSFLILPFGLTQPLFVPDYWHPIVLFRFFGLFDLESLLWCFFTGGIAAVLYEEIFKIRLGEVKNNLKAKHHAYFIYSFLLLTVSLMILIKYFTDWSVLRSSFIFMIIVFIYSVFSRPDLVKKSILSGCVFLIFYIASLLTVNALFPGFVVNEWNIQGSIGIRIFSIVIEEYIYAFLFGLVWSVIYEEIKNIKLKKAVLR